MKLFTCETEIGIDTSPALAEFQQQKKCIYVFYIYIFLASDPSSFYIRPAIYNLLSLSPSQGSQVIPVILITSG